MPSSHPRRPHRPAGRRREATAAEPRPAGALRWAPVAVGLVAGGLALALYLLTLAPTVTFADAGELASAVYHLDVAHPPGFPLYLLLAKLFTLVIPWGRVIVRTNAFSALCAAVAVGLFAAALSRGLALEMRRPAGRRAGRAPGPAWRPAGWLLPVVSLAAAGLLAASRTFWEQATLTEVYALNMALAAGLLLLLAEYLRARQENDPPRADRTLLAAALLAGLGMGNHLTLFFVAGALVLTAWLEEGVAFWHWRRLLPRVGFFLFGLTVYLYLPLRAQAAPPMNWGDPESWSRFWRHVSGRQYGVNFVPGWETWKAQGPFFLSRLWTEFSPLPLLLVPLGLYRLFRRCLSLAWATIAGAACTLFYALSYEIAEDQETYYMLVFLLIGLWMAHGMAQLLEWLPARQWVGRLGRMGPAGLFLLLSLWPLLANWPLCDRRSYTYAEAYARDVLDHLPPDAVVLTRYWNLFSPAYYMQQVEGVRPDVAWVDQELLRRTWYLETLARRYPWLMEEAAEPLEAFRVELVKFEEGRPYDVVTIQGRFQDLGNALLVAALSQGRPALVTPEVEYAAGQTIGSRYREKLLGMPPAAAGGVGEDYRWVPQALAFRLAASAPADLPLEEMSQPALWDGRFHDALTQAVVERYALFWLEKGAYYQAAGDCARAVPSYERALAIRGDLREAQLGIQSCR